MPRTRSQNKFIVLETKDGYERSDYGTNEPGKTIWEIVVDYINSLPIDHVFSRKELHRAVYTEKTALWHLQKGDVSTVDSYRGLLCKTPYVEPTKRPGRYRKKQQIPDHVTLTKLKNFAKCKDYKKWFIPFEEWIK